MTNSKTHRKFTQPESFIFNAENLAEAKKIIAKYPSNYGRSAVMPLLDLAQRQSGGWLPKVAMDYIAEMLCIAPIRVYEVASFYTMYNLEPVGKYHVQVCTTTPCWLCGSDKVIQTCEKELGIKIGGMTHDGKISLGEVECLGACVNAPMLQINDDFYEDLTEESVRKICADLKSDKMPKAGPQSGRHSSEPKDASKGKVSC